MTYHEELFTILMEECGELIQECSKCMRRGETTSESLIKEIGDVLCLIELAHQADVFSYDDTDKRYFEKVNKLKQWSSLIDG